MSTRIANLLIVTHDHDFGNSSQIVNRLENQEVDILGFTQYDGNGKNSTCLFVRDPERTKLILEQEALEVRKDKAVVCHATGNRFRSRIISRALTDRNIDLHKMFPYAEKSEDSGGVVLYTSNPRTTKRMLDKHREKRFPKRDRRIYPEAGGVLG